jgi:hypothetical protein
MLNKEHVLPYAITLTQKLVESFLRMVASVATDGSDMTPSKSDGDTTMAAMSTLTAINNIVEV